MKIVRITFSLGASNKEYFMDRPYDEQKEDQTNCDNALGFLIGSVKDGDAIAIMKENNKKAQPVLLNLKNVVEINILNVAVYQTKPVEQQPPVPAEAQVDVPTAE
jgi:hypothetical protein